MLICEVGFSRLVDRVVSLLQQTFHTSMRFQPHAFVPCRGSPKARIQLNQLNQRAIACFHGSKVSKVSKVSTLLATPFALDTFATG
jgi:hypothetical protein